MQQVDVPMDLEMQLLSSPSVNNDDDGGDSRTRNMIYTAIQVIRSTHIFTAGKNHGSPPVSKVSSSKSIDCCPEQAEIDIIECLEDDIPEFVDEPQTTPLLNTVDNILDSRKTIRTLTHVIRSSLALKEYATSASTDYVHRGTSSSIEGIPEISEANDNLVASSEHHITVPQLQHSQSKNISKIVKQKNFPTLQAFGGVDGVADALGTDLISGISETEAIQRCHQHAFSQSSENTNPFFHLVWETVKSKNVILLLLAAGLSVVFGIIEESLKNGWQDGLVILIATILLVFLASIRNYFQARRARMKLHKQPLTEGKVTEVLVIRGGELKHIRESKLVCGDVVVLKKGSQVPADGLFITGEDLKLDYGFESFVIDMQNPFLSYGERVINGEARMVVTSINEDTGWSEMMEQAIGNQKTKFKLETQVDKLNTCMHYTGLIISILIILVLLFRCMAGKMDPMNGGRPESKAEPTAVGNFVNNFKTIIKESKFTARVLIKLLIVSLAGVTEGVPFVVSLSIFYWNNKTLSGKATVQDSKGVAKMASVTRICTDTNGNFTQDEMEVEKLFIGVDIISGCTTISPNVVDELRDGIGTLEQRAIQRWANDKLGFKRERMMQKWKFIERRGTNSFQERCCVLLKGIGESEEMVLHFNGPVKEIIQMCTHYYDSKGIKAPIDDEVTRFFDQANKAMQHTQLRTIAFACKSTDTRTLDADGLVLVALVGLKNNNREATKEEVKDYRQYNIETIIVSSNKVSVLQDIAIQCGVITHNDSESSVLTGEDFRRYSDKERLEKVDKIRVLGETLPSDKLLFVETLKKRGEVVAFLGQRTDEAPALRAADIGIAIGHWSSEKARESCDIIIWDRSFSDLISIVDSGKCIYHNIQSFLQLVLISTISSTLINFSQTVAFGDTSLTIVQLVWINLTVSFFGGLALLTKPSTDKPESLVPIRCKRSCITTQMIRNILFQVVYQAIWSVIIQLKGSEVVGTSRYKKTIIFNGFVICQLFNQFNARELQTKNFFKGIRRHSEFWVAILTFIVLHASFVMVQDIFGIGTRLNWKLWAGCVLVGVGSWLVDWLGKCISWFIKISQETLSHMI